MPVNYLSEDQKAGYGNYHGELTKETLARYFHLDDFDRMNITPVSDTRIATLARYASTAKTTALQRLPEKRKLATLVAFSCCMEATASG